jgi:hypothetical protein
MLSREAMTQASYEYWLTMAEFWLKLAQAAGPKSKGMGKSK